jgi:ferritin-like metal-binding protein YciE
MSIDTLEGLLVEELQDLYSAETQTVKALPKMAKAASCNCRNPAKRLDWSNVEK